MERHRALAGTRKKWVTIQQYERGTGDRGGRKALFETAQPMAQARSAATRLPARPESGRQIIKNLGAILRVEARAVVNHFLNDTVPGFPVAIG